MSEQTILSTGSDSAGAEAQRRLPTTEKPSPDVPYRLGWGEWVEERFHWSWFTCTQSTGGIGIVLSECPKQFKGLQTIGKIVFIFNLAMFVLFSGLMVWKLVRNPNKFRKSFTTAPQCYFYGSFWLTIATIIISLQRYGVDNTGPWLVVVIRILFWMYAVVTFISTTIHFTVVFQYIQMQSIEMNPAWFFLVFNAMLTGTIASGIAEGQPPHHRVPIIVAGVAYQGLGWIVSMMILSWFLGNLMEKGWPPASKTPALFMTVGTSGYTIVALMGCAKAIPQDYGYFASHPMAAEVLMIMATWVGVFMWLFTLWLFGIAFVIVLSVAVKRVNGSLHFPMTFNNTWWGKLSRKIASDPKKLIVLIAFIFPNVGFTLATVFIGEELESNAIQSVSVAMTITVVAFWLMDLVLMSKVICLSLFRDARYSLT